MKILMPLEVQWSEKNKTLWIFTFESFPAGTSISIQQILTSSSILAWVWFTFIPFCWTVISYPAWVTDTFVPSKGKATWMREHFEITPLQNTENKPPLKIHFPSANSFHKALRFIKTETYCCLSQHIKKKNRKKLQEVEKKSKLQRWID